ncbi:hypothetical protein [Paenibacillus sp. Marseille-Q4541]|uniref:hypothetical protein n=1 Tax=Paenibacillus sp. Marseille-Q4541 TaxID=2831522 RepID=UPI001BAB29A3|nr:hypothetical protein [Paenibacillus sp. Marseille-Q4541]
MFEYYDHTEPLDLDTLVEMIKMHYAFENWEKVILLSNDLLDSAKEIHKELSKLDDTDKTFSKHIIFYFGYSYLMTGLSYQKLRQYAKAKEYISYYSDLSWLHDSTETGERIINDFHFFSQANSLTIEVLGGNQLQIPEYIEFLDGNPKQVLPGLITILESAINYDYNVDEELSYLNKHIQDYRMYEEKVSGSYYLSYQYMLALYHQKNGKISEAIDITLHMLLASDKLKNDKYFKKAISLFEVLRTHASVSQLKMCYDLLNDIIFKGEMINEENINFRNNPAGTDHRYYLT